jgi:MFS family permease
MRAGAARAPAPALPVTGFDRRVIALGVARMADAVANSFLVVVLPLYVASAQVPAGVFGLGQAATTGLILAVFGLANAAMQPFAGRLSDLAQRRRAFVIGGLLVVAALNALFTVTADPLHLLLIRAGQGLAVAFTVTGSVALVNEISVDETRGGNMGTYNALRLVGFGAGPLVAGFVVAGGPYRLAGFALDGFDAAFGVAVVGALVGAAMVAALVSDPPNPAQPASRGFSLRIRGGPREGVLDPVFVLGIATFTMAMCVALLAAIEPEVNERLGQDARWFGVQFGVFILSVAATQPFVGRASDRYGRRPFVLAGLVLLAPTTLAQGLVATPWQMLGARIAQGFAGAMVFAPALALGGDLVPTQDSGMRLAVLTMAFGTGLSAGQLLSGFLLPVGFLAPFAVGAGTALAAALVVWRHVPADGDRG